MNTMNIDQPRTESIWRTLWATVGTLACHCLAIAVATVVLVRVVPACLQLFEDRDVELPTLTIAALKLSYAFVNYWYLLVLALPIDGVVYFLLRRAAPKINWLATIVLVLPLLLAIVLLGFTVVAVFLPLVKVASQPVLMGG